MSYILENAAEATRLEKQLDMAGYDLVEELAGVRIPAGSRVLDAGCGSGVVSRQLAKRFPGINLEGCDVSDMRLHQAKTLNQGSGTQFFASSLEAIARPDATYDQVVCRYVFEHLPFPGRAASELHRVLKPGGLATIIDFDGILFNLHHENGELARALMLLRAGLGFDLEVGRKLPRILTDAGFKNVQWTATIVPFQGAALDAEIENMRQRFVFAVPALEKILGTPAAAARFCETYLAEMARPGNSLFYTKFIATGRK